MTDFDDVFDEIMLLRLSGAVPPEMNLNAYRRWIKDVSAPTDSQIESFAGYVADARSWYKHLPLTPPGAIFHFYIDPHAGVDRLVNSSGEVYLRTRTQDADLFHYSWIPTDEYRERFGCLAFSCAAGSAVFMDDQLGDTDLLIDNNCALPTKNPTAGAEYEAVLLDGNCHHPVLQTSCLTTNSPPKEVLEAGACALTALVHPRATEDFLVRRIAMTKQEDYKQLFPNGGLLDSISKRLIDMEVHANSLDETIQAVSSDPEFVTLIQQEKTRLRLSMIEAMQRMRQVVFQHSTPAQ